MSFDIPKEFFDPEAPLHEPKRFHHPGCSDGKDPCLIITRVQDGWTYFCHRCGVSGLKPIRGHSASTIRKWVKSLSKKPKQYKTRVTLPGDFSNEIPPHGRVWLYNYGITDEEITRHGIGYSPLLNRVILPVYNTKGVLVYWTGRYLKDAKADKVPKYLSVKDSTRQNVYHWILKEDASMWDKVVLVEDQLSAIKVSRVSNACGLLGSYVDPDLIKLCCDQFSAVYLWLDNDMAQKSIRISKKHRDLGRRVHSVISRKDPKCYDEDAIYKFIQVRGRFNT